MSKLIFVRFDNGRHVMSFTDTVDLQNAVDTGLFKDMEYISKEEAVEIALHNHCDYCRQDVCLPPLPDIHDEWEEQERREQEYDKNAQDWDAHTPESPEPDLDPDSDEGDYDRYGDYEFP